MKPSRDPLELSPHWHVDCRIVAELPDDNVVGTRFLINVLFGGAAVAAIIYTGLLVAQWFSLRYQIRDWEQRISDNRGEVNDIKRMQREYAVEALKIDQAYALVRPLFNVSSFISGVGRTRPEQMSIDTIDWNEAGITMRGGLNEAPEQASLILGNYVKTLNADDKIGTLFHARLTGADRGTAGDAFKFEISLSLIPPKP
jgi:hypothetical protein